ncbi:uncharacterized protein [Palaemon carinicauda]|uniref:uncharacterized protein n=1 Tax=Palaemon carinicauda TaxID=392227 RepID=UPI0035B57C64
MSTLSELTAIGEKLGLSGSDLAYFIKEQQEFERAKRAEQRDAEREQMEAEKAILAEKRALMEADKERLELEITLKSSKSDETSMSASVPAKFSDKWGTKLIPKFSESDVGKFFVAFEKVAHQLAWPKELWAVLVQSAFSGKAQVVYAALSAEDSGDYDIVKKMVLNAYQLIPEAYRQKFRSWRKMFNQTFVEWAGQKAVKLDEWLAAEEASTFAELRELVLLEDFKNNIPKDVRIHIEEFNIDNVNEAAKAADRFVLSHKHYGKKKTHWEAGVEKVEVIKGRESPSSPSRGARQARDIVCYKCDTVTSWPVEEVYLESPLVTGRLKLAVVSALPVSGVDLLIGNDVMQGSGTACASEGRKGASVVNERVMVNVKPVVPVTRAQSREEVKGGAGDINLENCFQTKTQPKTTKDRQTLISAQKEDRELKSIYEEAEELKEQDDLSEASYVLKNVLYRLIRPVTASADEEWKKDVVRHCKSCHQCQMVGKPNQKITKAPLIPIPAVEEPFTQIVIDIVGPLPKTKTGFQYMLTIMDRTTRFPEVIPVRGIKSGIVIKHLMDFFSRYGLPREIQSDQGSNFTSREFQAKMNELGIKHNLASSYHPESQGILERFHSTLKNALTKYCLDHMVYGHNVRGPLDLLREHWEGGSGKMNSLDYILSFKEKLRSIWQWAQNNLSTSQAKMKTHYDRKSQVRNFEAGEQVLVLLPMPGQFRAQFVGPAVVKKKLNDVDYLVEIPGRRKKYQLCHINIMKKYFSRANTVKSVSAVVPKECNGQEVESKEYGWNGENSKILCNPDSLFKHLNAQEATDIKDLFKEHPSIFKDTPGLVRSLQHDVVLKPNAQPIRQAPYRLSPQKAEAVRKEVSYMLENDLISPSSSPSSSPVVLVKKENGQDSDNWKDHVDRIRALFRAIADAGLVVNLSKCEFGKAEVIYLGHHVGQGKVLPKEKNIEAVLAFPTLKTRKNVRQFVGLAGYYRRFVPSFSEIVTPLTNLLREKSKFLWDDTCQRAFDKLKGILSTYPILISPDFQKGFKLMVDASDLGVGAVLLQDDSEGIEHPVSYFSRKLNEHQKKYSTIEKEALALVLDLQHFEIYVTSSVDPIIVYSDHNPLKFVNKFRNKNRRLTNWSLMLQEYNLTVKHVKGKDNVVADALSRNL